VGLVDHPLIPVHESRANSGDVVKIQLGSVDPLSLVDRFVADCVRSQSLFRAQFDRNVCELNLFAAAFGERSQGMVAVHIDEVQVSQLFNLVLSRVYLFHEGIFAAGTSWYRCTGACLAIWIRPAFTVFKIVDEVTDVVSAAKILKDGVESVHLDGRRGPRVRVVCVVLWGGREGEVEYKIREVRQKPETRG
jgi:hypothetical protein